MRRNLFITGTGTDIGKTFIATALIRQLRHHGCSVSALKPIISGWNQQDHSNDTAQIIQSLDLDYTDEIIQTISPWRFRDPLSPNMAAENEGTIVNFSDVVAYCQNYINNHSDYTIIEGAGGVMVPLNNHYTYLDLMVSLNIDIILVTGSYLGSISHTLTAYHCLIQQGLNVIDIIISESSDRTVDLEQTRFTLQSFCKCPITAVPRNAKDVEFSHLMTSLKRNTGY